MDYAMSIGFDLCALDFSPIKGPEGNIEYLIHLKKSENEDGENLGGLDPVIVSDRAFHKEKVPAYSNSKKAAVCRRFL